MKNIFGKILIGLVSFYILNTISLFSFGKTSLANRIAKDSHTTYLKYQWTKDVTIASNMKFGENQTKPIEKLYDNTKAEITFFEINEIDDLHEKLSLKETYLHVILIQGNLNWPTYSIVESKKMAEYSQSYKRQYIWIFFSWIKLSEASLGIS